MLSRSSRPSRAARGRRSLALGLLAPVVIGALGALGGCNESALQGAPDGGAPIPGLSQEQAARVVAKVGDKPITLGDFARTLDRMDQFDRLRYQTKERRRELLDEIIDVELLAAEAKRRGLDKTGETEDAVRQILRDALLSRSRKDLPAPAEIPQEDVRAYYQANIDRFREPERRRVGAIAIDEKDRKEADKVLKAALKLKNATEWGDLFYAHAPGGPKARGPNAPLDLAGDLGFVGPPGDPKGQSPKVPEPVRAAVFKIAEVGTVADDLVAADGKLWVVRMTGLTAAHSRTLAEADRSIRVLIIQQKMAEREKALEDELRKKFPVQIDEQALSQVKVPSVADVEAAATPRWNGDGPDAGAPNGGHGGAQRDAGR
jgi:hypothetical protein